MSQEIKSQDEFSDFLTPFLMLHFPTPTPESIREALQRDEIECVYLCDYPHNKDAQGRVMARVHITIKPRKGKRKTEVYTVDLPLEIWDHLSIFLLKVNSRAVNQAYGNRE